jgi:hypothetical protein
MNTSGRVSQRRLNKIDDKPMCDAVNCKEKAAEEIEINAGKYGTLILSVCIKCRAIFQD